MSRATIHRPDTRMKGLVYGQRGQAHASLRHLAGRPSNRGRRPRAVTERRTGLQMEEDLMTDALAVSRSSRAALVDAGGRFMASSEMAARAKQLGTHTGRLYFRGRIGALGEIPSHIATAMLGIFPSWVIDFTWRESATLPA